MSGRHDTGTRQGPTAGSKDPENAKKEDPEQKRSYVKGKGSDKQPLAGQQAKDDSQKLPSNDEKELWYTRGHLVNIIDIITPAIKGEQIPEPRKLLRYKDLDEFKDPGYLTDKLNRFDEDIKREIVDGILAKLILSVQEVNKYLDFYMDAKGLKVVIERFAHFEKVIVDLKRADASTNKMWDAVSEYVQYLLQLPALPSSPSHHHHHSHRHHHTGWGGNGNGIRVEQQRPPENDKDASF